MANFEQIDEARRLLGLGKTATLFPTKLAQIYLPAGQAVGLG